MKKYLAIPALLTAGCFILLSSFVKPVAPADFSGTWKLNEGKSNLGQFGRFAPVTIKIDQKADKITITKMGTGFDGSEYSTNETVTFDGKECESTGINDSKKKSTLKWADDGQSFVITYNLALSFQGQSMTITGTENWSLKDGVVTVETNSSSDFGENSVTSVYEK